MKLLLPALILVSHLTALGQAKVGQPAPDFAGTDVNGRTHRLSDYRGKIVVLEAYNPECPFAGNHYKTGAMQALQGNVVTKGVVWLVVSSSPASSSAYRKPEAARKEFADLGMKASALIDDNPGAIGRKYGLQTTPQVVVIDQAGVIAYSGAIDDRAATSGDPRTARNYVRQAIESLIGGRPVPVAETRPYGTPIKYAN